MIEAVKKSDVSFANSEEVYFMSEVHSEPGQTSMMVRFVNIFNCFQLLTIFPKCFILDV